jgi:hypothetical protein
VGSHFVAGSRLAAAVEAAAAHTGCIDRSDSLAAASCTGDPSEKSCEKPLQPINFKTLHGGRQRGENDKTWVTWAVAKSGSRERARAPGRDWRVDARLGCHLIWPSGYTSRGPLTIHSAL